VIYGDDSQRYVLDPLRGSKSLEPQKFDEYIKYYDDEINVRWYIGQSYSPLLVKEENKFDQKFIDELQRLSGKVVVDNVLVEVSIDQ